MRHEINPAIHTQTHFCSFCPWRALRWITCAGYEWAARETPVSLNYFSKHRQAVNSEWTRCISDVHSAASVAFGWMDSECEASAKRKQEIAWNRWNDWLTALLFSSGMFALKTQNCALWQIWLSLLTLVHHLCLLHYFFPIMLFLLIEHQAREMCTVAVFFNGHPTWLDVYLWDLEASVGICSVSNQIRDHTGTQGDCVGILAPLCGTPIWLCAKKITSQPVALPLWPPPPVTTFSSFIEPTTQPGKDWGVRWVLVWLCGTQRPQEAL